MIRQRQKKKFLPLAGIGLLFLWGTLSGEEIKIKSFGKENRFANKSLYEEVLSSKRKSPFNLYFSSGLGFFMGGDLNHIFRGGSNTWSGASEYFNWAEWKNKLNFQGEIILDLTRNIGIGVGSGYLLKKSRGIYRGPGLGNQRKYSFRFIPINGSLYLTVPANPIVSLVLKGGADYYFGNMRQEERLDGSGKQSLVRKDAECNALGFHIGGGIEFKVAPKMSLLINGLYRVAILDHWTERARDNEELTSRVVEGILYYYENHQLRDEAWYWIPRLTFWEGSGLPANRKNPRVGEIDIGGHGFHCGIENRFLRPFIPTLPQDTWS